MVSSAISYPSPAIQESPHHLRSPTLFHLHEYSCRVQLPSPTDHSWLGSILPGEGPGWWGQLAIAWAGWPSSKNPPFCHKEMKKNVLGLAQITAVQRRAVLPAVSREGGAGWLVGWSTVQTLGDLVMRISWSFLISAHWLISLLYYTTCMFTVTSNNCLSCLPLSATQTNVELFLQC